MIKINLLPVREARRQANLRQQALLFGIATGAAAIICIWLQVSIQSTQAKEQSRIVEARAELKALEATRQKVERFRKEKEEIESKLAVITELERNRQGPVRIMDEIATRIPRRMWLTEMKLHGGTLELQGVSLDAEIVAAFLAGLGESELFHDVELDETRLTETDGLKLNSFKIHSRYGSRAPVLAEAAAAPKGRGRRK
jgi:type IV pilus assembly protein PilN